MHPLSRRSVLAGALALPAAACMPAPAGPAAGGPEGACGAVTADAAGFDAAALQRCLDEFAAGPNRGHGLVIERAGVLAAEVYRTGEDATIGQPGRTTRFDACTLHDMRSISKSVTTLLWGIAAGRGLTPPLETPVVDLYPDLKDLRSDGRDTILLRHLMTMTAGLEWDERNYGALDNPETALFLRSSQARVLFDRPVVAAPGTQFIYCGGCTALLGDLLARAVGTTLPQFAEEALFAPLGIANWAWIKDYRGRAVAFAGLRLTPRDMTRLGRLVLNRGQWQGAEIVPAAWIDESVQAHADAGDGLRYGYQWWLGEVEARGARHAYVAGFGNGGQRLYIVPTLDLVTAITAGGYNSRGEGLVSAEVFRNVARALV